MCGCTHHAAAERPMMEGCCCPRLLPTADTDRGKDGQCKKCRGFGCERVWRYLEGARAVLRGHGIPCGNM